MVGSYSFDGIDAKRVHCGDQYSTSEPPVRVRGKNIGQNVQEAFSLQIIIVYTLMVKP